MRCFILVFFLFFASCRLKEESNYQDYILSKKDIIPEGVAFVEAIQTANKKLKPIDSLSEVIVRKIIIMI